MTDDGHITDRDLERLMLGMVRTKLNERRTGTPSLSSTSASSTAPTIEYLGISLRPLTGTARPTTWGSLN
jgi:hypothetical protein